MLHVDRSTIAKWESGARLPDADMIARLSACLGTDVGRFLRASEKNAEKWNVMLVDDEKIILNGALPVLSEALPEAEIHGFSRPEEAARSPLMILTLALGAVLLVTELVILIRRWKKLTAGQRVFFLVLFALPHPWCILFLELFLIREQNRQYQRQKEALAREKTRVAVMQMRPTSPWTISASGWRSCAAAR